MKAKDKFRFWADNERRGPQHGPSVSNSKKTSQTQIEVALAMLLVISSRIQKKIAGIYFSEALG